MELTTEIEIYASDQQVWHVLTDFASFPQWNPFIRQASGSLSVGSRLTVRFQPPGTNGMTFRPTVRTVEPKRELRWLGHFLIPGLFDGDHRFMIEPLTDQQVRFIQQERFEGLLVPLLTHQLNTKIRQGFAAMNQALKSRAEQIEQMIA
jgi:hypothetical protein